MFLLMDCARIIEDEIAARSNQTDIAKTYALAMVSEQRGGWEADWPRVNKAILDRWSMAGLIRVKKLAHQTLADIGKARAGALLDGVAHKETPA